MKFSLNVGQYYSNVELKSLPHDELVQKMGLQLGAIEDVIEWGEKYSGIVVVKIVEFRKHPDADKLSVCRIDDNGVTQNVDRDEEGYVQVVCGAPNVKGGLLVAWIPPGATVPSTLETDSFVLEARKIRGIVSNGMLASPKELDISDEHEGILVLHKEEGGVPVKIGDPISKYFGLDDVIVDCENKMFTHRPDCFGNLGIARELAGIYGMSFQSPDWYTAKSEFIDAGNVKIHAENPIPELVPRFMVVAMDNVTIKPSPVWMQSYLKRVGIKPINNIVDVTNFIMHLTGQPLHAFDRDKLIKKSAKASSTDITLQPRMAKKGEELLLLGDKKITLNENDIVIATDSQAVALAGIMGGAETEVDETTKHIVIECANFDMYAVRRSSMRHGLFTEAVTRFNKGQSPLQNDRVLAYAIKNFSEVSGAIQASPITDLTAFDAQADNLNHVDVTAGFINERLGTTLTPEEIRQLLENVEFAVSAEGELLHITVPFWRMDISIAEDVVEEVGRLYGYENVPVELPPRLAEPTPMNQSRVFKQSLRETLSKLGANEVLTYSFVHGDLLKKVRIEPELWAYHLRNALSPDLQYFRPALIVSLLAKVHANIKAQAGSTDNQFALYELGKAHIKGEMEPVEPQLPKQMQRLALVFAADAKTAKQRYDGASYYVAKQYVDELTKGSATYAVLDDFSYPMTSVYKKGRSATILLDGKPIGVVGEINQATAKALKLPEFCAGFEIDIDLLHADRTLNNYRQLSTFPSIKQDITFEVAETINWDELYAMTDAELAVAAAEDNLQLEVSPLAIYQQEGSENKRISFRIELSHQQKTLKMEEVNKLLNHVAEAVHEKLGAVRI